MLPDQWAELVDRDGHHVQVPAIPLKEKTKTEINGLLAEHGLAPIPFRNGPAVNSLLLKEELEKDGILSPLENPAFKEKMYQGQYAESAQFAVEKMFAQQRMRILTACENLGLDAAETKQVYLDSHYRRAEAFVQHCLADPMKLAEREYFYGTGMHGEFWVPDKTQPHYQAMQQGQPDVQRVNPYAQTRAAKEILAIHEALQPKAKAYFEAQGLDFHTPCLHFIYEPSARNAAASMSAIGVIEINLAQYIEHEPKQSLYKYEALLAHEYAHDAFEDRMRPDGMTNGQWTTFIEQRAERTAAEILGSPVPTLHNYMAGAVKAGRLSRIPSPITPASVNAAADEIEAAYQGRLPRRPEPGYPHPFENMRYLATLDFGWEQGPAQKPTNTVGNVENQSRITDKGKGPENQRG